MEYKKYQNPYLEEIFKRLSLRPDDEGAVVVGSSSLKGSYYESDFDLFEVVKMKSWREIISRLKRICNDYEWVEITDIKLGLDKRRILIPDNLEYDYEKKTFKGYNREKLLERLEEIKEHLSIPEYKKALKLLVVNPSLKQAEEIKKELRFHILRWTPKDIKKGYLKLTDGKKKTIKEALQDNTLFKIDYLIFYNSEYIEISVIYDIRDKKNKRLTYQPINAVRSLQNDVNYYVIKKDYYKSLKRKVSLLRLLLVSNRTTNKEKTKEKIRDLEEIINSQLSILYKAYNLISALEKTNRETKSRRTQAINRILQYLTNCNLSGFMKKELEIKEYLERFKLKKAGDIIYEILNNETFKVLAKM